MHPTVNIDQVAAFAIKCTFAINKLFNPIQAAECNSQMKNGKYTNFISVLTFKHTIKYQCCN